MRTARKLLVFILPLCVASLHGATITNVLPVNVTPSSFSILWRTVSSTPSIAVYADPAGLTNLNGQLGVETFPVHTGNPALAPGYDRRQSQMVLRQQAESFGQMLVRVTGCQPGTTYYYRLTSTPPVGSPLVYPSSGPLPGVTTEVENTFVVDDQQLIIDIPGLNNYGRIVTLSNANDLFQMAGGGNFGPVGSQLFTVDALSGGNASDTEAQFSLNFGTNLTVASASDVSIGTEFLSIALGSVIMQTGQGTNIVLSFNSSVPVTNLNLTLNLPAGHLTNLVLQALAPEVDPASLSVTPQGANTILHVGARVGQAMTGAKPLAALAFNAVSGQHSAFVPIQLLQIGAAKTDGSGVTNVFRQSGRAVVIGPEALLEAGVNQVGARSLLLYGKPFSSYAVDYATNISTPVSWTRLPKRIPMTDLVYTVPTPTPSPRTVFYRAVEFFANPALLEAETNPDGTRRLLLYGVPSKQYTVQASTNISNVAAWLPVANVTLTNSFSYQMVSSTNNAIFYRLKQN